MYVKTCEEKRDWITYLELLTISYVVVSIIGSAHVFNWEMNKHALPVNIAKSKEGAILVESAFC